MKKKALLASVITIALCFSAIAGSTYALFTDAKEVNIAVTSGDVEVAAHLTLEKIWSAKADPAGTLVDEYGGKYVHEEKVNNFTNGGTAIVDGANVNVYKITPGDKIDLRINVENTGDVAMRYRYVVTTVESNAIAQNMILTDHNGAAHANVSGTGIYYSEWFGVLSNHGDTASKVISVELPIDAQNDCQTEYGDGTVQSVTFIITVEAVQGNAYGFDEPIDDPTMP